MSKRKSFTAETKLSIIEYAENNGNREAARHFKINESSVRDWRKQKEVLKVMNRNKRALRHKTPHWPELENKLCDWVLEQNQKFRAVSTIQIILEARRLALPENLNIIEFKGTSNWCHNFMKRNDLRVRRKTTTGQELPTDWEEKLVSFKVYVENAIKHIDLRHIGNMDEISLSFDMPSNYTVVKKGEKIIKVVTNNAEKCCFTVVLCVTANGEKLNPMVIFKRKTIPKQQFPEDIIVKANEKGWMISETMVEWLDLVWRKRKGAFFQPKSVLIFDSAPSHLTEVVKEKIKTLSQLAVIPGGLTKLLQPLDISVNKSFKNKIRKCWEKWMVEGYREFTRGNNPKRASYSEVCNWISKSWNDVSADCVKNGFRKSNINYYGNIEVVGDSESESDSTDIEIPEELLDVFDDNDSSDQEFSGF